LDALAKLAFGWRWEDKGTALLWKYAQSAPAPRAVLDTLWDVAMRRGDSATMLEVAKLRAKADRATIQARNNVVLLQLLTRSKESGIHEAADALLAHAPDNSDVVATHAWSLHQRRLTVEAIDALKKLPAEELLRPDVARYFGAILADAGRHEEAREFLATGSEGFLLAEEEALLARAKAAATAAETPDPKSAHTSSPTLSR
jgi:hypothetical protein